MKKELTVDYSYHSHTYRCRHAVGSDEDYVRKALKAGIKVLGFSDHIMFPDYSMSWRGDYDVLPSYLFSVRDLQEKYKDKITIHLAFESEYLPQYVSYYERLFDEEKIDYMIIGQHIANENGELIFYRHLPCSPAERALRYKNDIIEGFKTGLFAIAAHPDHFMSFYPEFDELAEQISLEIIEAAIKYDVILELNISKVDYIQLHASVSPVYGYPHPKFWELVGKMGAKMNIGIDAHDPIAYRSPRLDVAFDMIEKYNLIHVTRIELPFKRKKHG